MTREGNAVTGRATANQSGAGSVTHTRRPIAFAIDVLSNEGLGGCDVLEVGSWKVQGTARETIEALGPESYIGTDIVAGPGVDVICRAEQLAARFGRDKFDIVVATEVVEHIRNWRAAFQNMMAVLRPDGLLVITTRSRGYPYHGSPHDYWRYEPNDIRLILDGWQIVALQSDERPGVFVAARKTTKSAARLETIALYSMALGRRTVDVTTLQVLRHRLSSPRRVAAWLTPNRLKAPLRRVASRFGYSAEYDSDVFG